MNFPFKTNLLAGFTMLAAMSSVASPVERAGVVADPAWVLHLDVDALRSTAVGKQILAEMRTPAEDLRYAVIKAVVGFDPRTALHGVTVYGASPAPEDGVALVYADIDSAKLMSLAKEAEDFRAGSHGSHKILSWTDSKKGGKDGGKPRTYAAIFKDRLVIFAQREARLTGALDVLDGIKASLAKGSAFPGFGAGEPLVIQGVARQIDLPGSDPAAAIFKQSKLIGLDVRESGRDLLGSLSLDTNNQEAAEQVANIARGIIAIVALQKDNPDAVKLARSLSVEQTASRAIVKLKIPSEEVLAAIKANAAKEASKEKSSK